jgi:type I restriction enzyme, S subunit
MCEWRTTTIGDVLTLQRGIDITRAEQRPGMIPVVSSGGISSYHDTAAAKGPGVVIGRKGTLGKTFYLPGDYWPHDTALWVKDFKGGYPRFVYYFFVNLDVKGLDVGSANPTLNRNHVHPLSVRWPERTEQVRIANLLGVLDDKIAVNDQIAITCRELVALRYLHAVSLGAKSVQISEVAELYDGPHATPKKTEVGPWFLSISSLSGGRLLLDGSAHLSEDDFKHWTRRVTPRFGDVLFSYETRLGEAALMPSGIQACLGRRMALLRPRNVGSRTLLQAFLSRSFQETIRKYSIHGATVDRIPLSEFSAWNIELPAQEPGQLEEDIGSLDDLAQQRERESESLALLRDTLLPKLMSGEIRVRDAEKVVEEVT